MSRPTDEVANETRSTQITIAADRIFSTSNSLSGVSRCCLIIADCQKLMYLSECYRRLCPRLS